MAENTKIEWAHHTFNPWMGCQKVSAACKFCYAEALAKRYGKPELWKGTRQLTSDANWRKPLAWNKAAQKAGTRMRVFCASLADVFEDHPAILPEWRRRLFKLIEDTPNLSACLCR